MANTLLTPTAITREFGRILHQKLNFVGSCNKQYDDSYKNGGSTVKGKFGPTLKVKLPPEYTVRSGLTMSTQDVTETSVDLTVSTVKGVDVNFTSLDLAQNLTDFSKSFLDPAASVLAANIEADALSMYQDVYNLYDGDAAAFSFTSLTNGRQILTDNLTPMDNGRVAVLNTSHATKYMIDTKGLFNPDRDLSEVYRNGALSGSIMGFNKVYENTLLLPHQTGTAAKTTGYLVNGANQTGGTLTIDTGTTTLAKGDVFTIAGVFRVHPETKVSTGQLQQFVVRTTTGTSATSVEISPSIYTSGGRWNVSNSPADNAAITKVGAGASETMIQSLAFHKDAFAFVTADLPLPDGTDFAAREVVDGISISLVRDFTITDRSFPCRIDVLYGYKTIRPQLACRIHNDG